MRPATMLVLFATRTELIESERVRSTPLGRRLLADGRRPREALLETQRIEFNRDGWKVEVRSDDGLMQITGRSPSNTRHLLLHVVEISGAGVAGRPAMAIAEGGQIYELVTAAE
jgi:hypothetical protein